MSLTEALRARDPEAHGLLYDEHGSRLYAYCHVMVGDDADDAVRDTFVAAVRHSAPPPHDDVLPVWLFTLAREQCARRGMRGRPADPAAAPLERALARLRAEHREALALTATLEPEDFARVIGVARDTADLLLRMARRRLEQTVLTLLGGRGVPDDDLVTALGQGRLHTRVLGTVPAPPAELRERVVAACAATVRTSGPLLFGDDGLPIRLDALFGPAEAATMPQRVVGGAAVPVRGRARRSRRRGLAETVVLAACVAATVAAATLWPAQNGSGGASNVDGTSDLVRTGSPAHSPRPSTTGMTPLGGGSDAGRAPSTATSPRQGGASGTPGHTNPAPAGTTAATGSGAGSGSARPSPGPTKPVPEPSTPSVPAPSKLPPLVPSATPGAH